MNNSVEYALKARPSERQLAWHETGYYGLISFGIPTFNRKQYGDGFAPASMFCPENPDMSTDPWAELAVKAGMKGLVLNVKQYDGFCLWQTSQTDYSIAGSSWLEGKADLVRMVSDSCKKNGLKFGIQLSLWDRHDKRYGKAEEYNDFLIGMLTELLTNYGELFYIRLDPTVGSEERHDQKYDWKRIYSLIRKLQPGAVIAFAGPDVRWSGNERISIRESEWATLPAYLGIYEDGTEAKCLAKKHLSLIAEDLGSEKAIKGEENFIWYPSDLCFPMRAHWYFDEDDKYSVKTKDKLLKAYFGSAGNNGCMMLGLSPDRQGKFSDTEEQILTAFGYDLKMFFCYNLIGNGAEVSASSEVSAEYGVNNVASEDKGFWKPSEKDKKPTVTIENPTEEPFDKIVICENISNGQAVSEFEIYSEDAKGKMKKIYTGYTVGFRKICPVGASKSKKVVIKFTSFRKSPEISYISIN